MYINRNICQNKIVDNTTFVKRLTVIRRCDVNQTGYFPSKKFGAGPVCSGWPMQQAGKMLSGLDVCAKSSCARLIGNVPSRCRRRTTGQMTARVDHDDHARPRPPAGGRYRPTNRLMDGAELALRPRLTGARRRLDDV